MATPRGLLSLVVNIGSGEQSIAASVPTFGDWMRVTVHSASIVYTTQPSANLPTVLTGSTGHLLTPAIGPAVIQGPLKTFRFRDLGAAGIIVMSFHEGDPRL